MSAQKSLEYRFKEIYIDLYVCAILIELGNGIQIEHENQQQQRNEAKYSNTFY